MFYELMPIRSVVRIKNLQTRRFLGVNYSHCTVRLLFTAIIKKSHLILPIQASICQRNLQILNSVWDIDSLDKFLVFFLSLLINAEQSGGGGVLVGVTVVVGY